jgi:N-carbamoylputrescine amidase
MHVACIQMASVLFDREANLQAAGKSVAAAAGQGASLVVLPEFFATGCAYEGRLASQAEPLEGRTVEWMRSVARGAEVWLAAGIVERMGKRMHDTLVLVSPAGRSWAYRKRYLPFFEKLYFTPGRGVGVLDTPLGRIGVMICWDMFHNRLARELSGRIDLLLICSAWPDVTAGVTRFPWVARCTDRMFGRPALLDCPTTVSLPFVSGWVSRPPVHRPRQLAARLNVPVVYCNMAGPFTTRLPGFPGLEFDSRYAGASAILNRDGSGTVGPTTCAATLHGDVILGGTPVPGVVRRRARAM